jgi:hypothetical protein
LKKSLVGLLLVPSLLLGAVVGVGVESEAAYAAVAPSASELSYARTTILNQTNAARANVGLPPLVANSSLNNVAQNCSQRQATNNSMAHCDGFQNNYPAGWTVAAENVAYGYSVENVVSAWTASSGHYANMTDARATDIGIGYYLADDGTAYYTQNFAGYAATKTAPSRVGAIGVSPQGNGGANVTFVAPSSTGNSPITSYEIQAVANGYPTVTASVPAPGTHTITGLKGGVTYSVTVRAANAVGAGSWSPATSVTATGVPTVAVNSIDVTSTTATVNFGVNNGGLALTNVTATLSSKPNAVLTPDATSYTFTGMRPGSTHTGTIYATNSLGNSEAIPFTFTTLAVAPDAPTANGIVENKTSIKVSWTEPPFDGGAAISGYEVRLYDNSDNVVSTQTVNAGTRSSTFTGLTRGQTYKYDVTAVNVVGGTPSTRSSLAVPITAPTAVQNFAAALTDEQEISLDWQGPVDNGGQALTGYEITVIANGTTQETKTVTGTNVVFGSDVIKANTNYTFSIRANNGLLVGPSTFSNAIIVPATPTVSNPVTNVTISNVGTTSARVSWIEPNNNGGSAITGYKYEVKTSDGKIVANGTTEADKFVATVNGLNLYTDYTVTVYATNKKGDSNGAVIGFKTLAERPNAPEIKTVSIPAQTPTTLNVNVGSTNNGGDKAITYTVNLIKNGETVATKTSTTGAVAFTGLEFNSTYSVSATATNSAGTSPVTTSNEYETAKTSQPVTDVKVAINNKNVNITWKAPTNTGTYPVSSYVPTIIDSTGKVVVALDAVTKPEVTLDLNVYSNLVNGQEYSIAIIVKTGSNVPGTESVTNFIIPATTPFAVQNVNTTPADKKVNVSWVAPSRDGGSPISSYIVKLYNENGTVVDAKSVSGNITSVDFTNNIKAVTSYYVTVEAVNTVGNGTLVKTNVFSSGQHSPSEPATSSVIYVSGSTIRGNISGVQDNGGSAITGYEYSVFNVTDNVLALNWTKTPTTTFDYVAQNGKTFRVDVRAINSVGAGNVNSSTVNVPVVAPSVVQNVTTTNVTDSSVDVNWKAPANNGGAAISSYTVQVIDANDKVVETKTVAANTTATNFSNLNPRASYTANVVASNGQLNSKTSSTNFTTTAGVAKAPTNVEISLTGPESTIALVEWDASAAHSNVENLLRYNVRVMDTANGEVVSNISNVSTTSALTSGLVRGHTYNATVTASYGDVSSVSSIAASVNTITVATVAPSSARNVVLITDAKLIPTVKWAASSDNGGAEINYAVSIIDPDGKTVASGSTKTLTWTGSVALSPNTKYEALVVASNVSGSSEVAKGNYTTATLPPSEARNVIVESKENNGSIIDAKWVAPANNGGGTVTYTVALHDAASNKVIATKNDVNSTSTSFTGVNRGVTYYVTVVASNSAGSAKVVQSNNVLSQPIAPTVPTNVKATVNDKNDVTVNWLTPTYNGGSPVTSYKVVIKDSNNEILVNQTVTSTTLNILRSNHSLKPNSVYNVEVVAINNYGVSLTAESTFNTKVEKASAPRNATITVNQKNATVDVSFDAVTNNGGENVVYAYEVRNAKTNEVVINNTNITPGKITGILVPRGQEYVLAVTATNSAGATTVTTEKVSVNAVQPDAPTGLVIDNVTTSNEINFSWTAPAYNGGATVTGYEYVITDANGETIVSGQTSSVKAKIASGVLAPNKTYSVSIKAVNVVGSSAALNSKDVIKTNIVVPGKASIEKVETETNSATVSFVLPTDLGGDTNFTYLVALYKDNVPVSSVTTASPVEFTGLNHATTYEVRVTVTNSAGSTSVAKTFKTNSVAPSVPTDIKAEITGEQSAIVTWVAPSDNGGETITGYVVEYMNASRTVTGSITVPSTTATITGLPLGDEYFFTVTAVNSVGNSPVSAESETVSTAPASSVTPLDEKTFETMIDTLPILEVTKNGNALIVKVPDANEDAWFAGFAYSEPVALGWSFVNNGALTYDVSNVAVGDHYIAVYTADGQLYGAAKFNVAEEPVAPENPVTPEVESGNNTPTTTDGTVEKTNSKPSENDDLASTGVNLLLPAGAGLLLLLSGLGLAFVSRRRKETELS